MIHATNIGVQHVVVKDHKKKTAELVTKYKPIGMVDDFYDSKENDNSKFSIEGKKRHL